MKRKHIATLTSLFIGLGASAQILNGNFEQWTGTTLNQDSAYNWSFTNHAVRNITSTITTNTQSFNPQSGTSACAIHTWPFGFAQTPVLGIAVNGKAKLNFDAVATSYISGGGTPINYNPSMLEGYYYVDGPYDGLAIVLISKFNTSLSKRDTLALSSIALTPVGTKYSRFSLPINYTSTTIADSITILFYSSSPTAVPSVNCAYSTLYLDNLSLVQPGVNGAISQLSGIKTNDTINNTLTIEAWIKNVGTVDISNFDISYAFKGSPQVTETHNSTILAGDSAKHTFNQSWTPNSSGNYNLCVYLNGIMNDISSLNDTVCVSLRSTLRLNSLTPRSIQPYPNPASEFMNIEIDQPVRYAIFGSTGKQILEGKSNTNFRLNTSDFQSGIYFLQLLEAQSSEVISISSFSVQH